jgi:hypothetical protein
MVVTGVADRVPERIAQLVYVDAFVPHDGDVATEHDAHVFDPEGLSRLLSAAAASSP